MRGRRGLLEERLVWICLRLAAVFVILAPVAIVLYLGREALQLFTVDHVSLAAFFGSPVFDPDNAHPGAASFIAGSLLVTICALLLGAPLGLGSAICIAELTPPRIAQFFRMGIEVLAGVPSVVFGWLGLQVVVPMVRGLGGAAGFGIASAAIVLAVMILPTIVTLAISALRRVPLPLRENSMALGATRFETLSRVIIPAARSGLIIAMILALARAIGETLAVEMVIGNAGILPHDLVHAAATLPTEIVLDVGGAPPGSLLEHALFAMAFVLLLIAMTLLGFVRLVAGGRRTQ